MPWMDKTHRCVGVAGRCFITAPSGLAALPPLVLKFAYLLQ
jgi:hypothetical protein